jgi:hypothetical protein
MLHGQLIDIICSLREHTSIFADKLLINDRDDEPVATFEIWTGATFGLYPPNGVFWYQLIVVGALSCTGVLTTPSMYFTSTKTNSVSVSFSLTNLFFSTFVDVKSSCFCRLPSKSCLPLLFIS